jgi:hypothetical protein
LGPTAQLDNISDAASDNACALRTAIPTGASDKKISLFEFYDGANLLRANYSQLADMLLKVRRNDPMATQRRGGNTQGAKNSCNDDAALLAM